MGGRAPCEGWAVFMGTIQPPSSRPQPTFIHHFVFSQGQRSAAQVSKLAVLPKKAFQEGVMSNEHIMNIKLWYNDP